MTEQQQRTKADPRTDGQGDGQFENEVLFHLNQMRARQEAKRRFDDGDGQGTTDDDEPLYADVAALLDGDLPEPPQPSLLLRTDGHALFYPGQVNTVFGDPETGKTWITLAACVEALRRHQRVLIVDIDHNGLAATVSNLLALGAPEDALRDLDVFRYCEPSDAADVNQVVADCRDWHPAVAVVDSIGELLPMLGASSDSSDEYTLAHTRVLKPLAVRGATVLAVDHLAKNKASRAMGPTGAVAKRRAVGGLSLRVKTFKQFAPGEGGAALLYVNKDRHGGVRRYCPSATEGHEQFAGTFLLNPGIMDGPMSWRVTAPSDRTRETASGSAGASEKTDLYLDVLTDAAGWITTAQAAVAVFGDDEATEHQKVDARYHLKKLVEAGLAERSQTGSGQPANWRLAVEPLEGVVDQDQDTDPVQGVVETQ